MVIYVIEKLFDGPPKLSLLDLSLPDANLDSEQPLHGLWFIILENSIKLSPEH